MDPYMHLINSQAASAYNSLPLVYSIPQSTEHSLAAEGREYLPYHDPSVLSSLQGVPMVPSPLPDLNAQRASWQSFRELEPLHRTQIDPATSLGNFSARPAAAATQLALPGALQGNELLAHIHGNALSLDNHVPSNGLTAVMQEQPNPLFSVQSLLEQHQSLNAVPSLSALSSEVRESSLGVQSHLYNLSDPALEVLRRASAPLAFTEIPREIPRTAQPPAITKKRKFQYAWERDDSWSRDEYEDVDIQDTGTTEAKGFKVENRSKVSSQGKDQARSSKESVDFQNLPKDNLSEKKSEAASAVKTAGYAPKDSPFGIDKRSKETKTTKTFGRLFEGSKADKKIDAEVHKSKRGEEHVRGKSKQKLHKDDDTSSESQPAQSPTEGKIFWPPAVVIYNTRIRKTAEGIWDGMGGKEMDNYLKGIGHSEGKSKPIWGKQGHKGLVLVRFKSNLSGLKEAQRLHEYFDSNGCGRQKWLEINSLQEESELEDGEDFVHVDPKTKEKKRILYGFLAGTSDFKNLDPVSKIKYTLQSKSEILSKQHLLEKADQ